jgi:serine/threonine-protein kinase
MRVMAGARSRAAEVTQRLSRKASPLQEREVLDDRYELRSLIGCGGMAEVYTAYDRQLERVVAIKRPRRDMPQDAIATDRLRREAIALATIESPHVVAIHDVAFTPNGLYLVMQLVSGRTLEEEIIRNGSVTPAWACRIARDILTGLAALHASGLVHRDLKASNVLLDRDDRAVLLDLGAALHQRKRPLTAPGTVLGTPECMAPEQREQRPLDGRVDLFQLGLMLIYLLTGMRADSTVDPSQLTLPQALRAVITRALSPVGERYVSTMQMQSALETALAACTLEPIEPVASATTTMRWPEIAPPRQGIP